MHARIRRRTQDVTEQASLLDALHRVFSRSVDAVSSAWIMSSHAYGATAAIFNRAKGQELHAENAMCAFCFVCCACAPAGAGRVLVEPSTLLTPPIQTLARRRKAGAVWPCSVEVGLTTAGVCFGVQVGDPDRARFDAVSRGALAQAVQRPTARGPEPQNCSALRCGRMRLALIV